MVTMQTVKSRMKAIPIRRRVVMKIKQVQLRPFSRRVDNHMLQMPSEEEEMDDPEEFAVADQQQRMNVQCGKPEQFNVTMDSYFYGGVPMPWDVMIIHRKAPYRGEMQCLGAIVQLEKNQHHSNESRHVVTTSNCLDYNPERQERKFKFRHMTVAAKLSGRKGAYRGLFKTKVLDAFLLDDSYSDMPAVVLKLEKPISFGKNAQPVCLGTQAVPVYPEYCYLTGYMTGRKRVREYHALLDRSFPCTEHDHQEVEGLGVCARKQKLKNVNHVGGPLVCTINGVALLYGVYINEFDAIEGTNKIMKKRAFFADIVSSRLLRKQVRRQDNSTVPELENEEQEETEEKDDEKGSSQFGTREVELGEFVSSENGPLFNMIAKLYSNSSVKATTTIGPSAGIVAHVITLRNHYKPTISGTATFLTDFPMESMLVTNLQGIKRRSGNIVYIYTGTKKNRSDIKPMVITVRAKTEHMFFRNYKRLGMSTLSLFYHINTTTTGCPLICQAKNEWKLYASRAKLAPAQEENQNKSSLQPDEDIVPYVITQFKRENEFSDTEFDEEEDEEEQFERF
ncbi:Trypsin domain containing protein [Trichuris trichiura]|uniref:Trypsin domain containing protein n=1 Tax=Trichuris trichiura TaxID=36087 RepID=A0A077ZFM2_TRITR|nr:Trypsin domain containing protein [Trichuris trichiura]